MKQIRILVVDDDRELSELIIEILELRGYSVISVCSILEAFEKLHGIDLVIVDSFDGQEFSLSRQCKIQSIPCIYHTGRSDVTDEEYYLFDVVVTKPGFPFLLKSIENLV